MESNYEWGNELPAYFIATGGDVDIILKQMGKRKFDPELLLGVASRCPHGKPQVILCKSLLNRTPFPNNFWLSCPFLVKMAGQLESFGGVKKLETYIKENSKADWGKYNRLHTKIRVSLADKNELDILKKNNSSLYENFCDNSIGMGGIKISDKVQVKCLHLQIASYLSLRFHPGQDWLNENISLSCQNACDTPSC
ncbi:MAG: DUF501 domain-containing protein [Synergistaceae bacterium]|nr:DUF501 domain-containing protein [Synergistaceae bacterium]